MCSSHFVAIVFDLHHLKCYNLLPPAYPPARKTKYECGFWLLALKLREKELLGSALLDPCSNERYAFFFAQ